MDQEFIKPENEPKSGTQGIGAVGSMVAAVGATLLLFCLTGAAMVATVWAVSKLFGLPDFLMYALFVAGAVPVLWLTVWTAGRAWHVEGLLESHRDIDAPDFRLGHYFRKLSR